MQRQYSLSPSNAPSGIGDLSAAYGLWDWDLDRNLIYADQAAAQMFGFCAAQAKRGVPPEAYFERIHEDDRQMVINHSRLSIATLGVCSDNFRIVGEFGAKWVHSQGRCFADGDDNPRSFVGLIAEIADPFEPGARAPAALHVGGVNDDILYLCLHAKRIAAGANRPFLAYLLDMAIAEATELDALRIC